MKIIDRPEPKPNEVMYRCFENKATTSFVSDFMKIRYNTGDEVWFKYNKDTDEFDVIEITTHDGLVFKF